MQHSYNQLAAHRLQEFQVTKIHGGIAYTEIISSTMDKYSTALVNRIEGDMTQWMTNLYSLRLREVADQQDPPTTSLEAGAADKLGLYMNDDANPPVFPSTLSDFGNSDNGKAIIQQVQDESNVDLRIIHNMSTLKAHYDTNQRRVESHYRKLHERIVHIETGSWVTMDKALTRIDQLLQVPFATNDVGIITSIARLSQALLGLLQLTQQSVTDLVTISDRLGLEHRLYETHWNSGIMDTTLGTLRISATQNQQVVVQSNLEAAVDLETGELSDLIDTSTVELTLLRDNLINEEQVFAVSQQHYNEASRLYFANDRFGNEQLLRDITEHCQQSGTTTTPGYAPLKFTQATISQHCDVFTKYAYNIARHLEQFNNNQVRATDLVQKEAPISWCWREIKRLDEYGSMGKHRRSSLVRFLRKIIPTEQTLDRERLAYLSDGSIAQLETTIMETRCQIQKSMEYLRDPETNHHLYDQCFKPELHDIAKEQRLFNLVPKPSFIKKYIKLTNGGIKTLLRHVGLGTYVNDEGNSRPWEDQNTAGGYLMTEGYATSVPFHKPLTNNTEQLPELLPEDFKGWGFKYLNIWGADPGVSSIYVASNGSDNDVYHGRPDALDEDHDRTRLLTGAYDEHEIRRFSTVEYYTKA
ncbi:hypothetical protein DFQ29_001152, partial [Apophysomyces sp. BC1021]